MAVTCVCLYDFYFTQKEFAGNSNALKVAPETHTQNTRKENVTSIQHKEITNRGNVQSGLIAYISPETGELVTQPAPTNQSQGQGTAGSIQPKNIEQEIKELPPIEFTSYPDGMVTADLNGHFMVPQMATIDCNGEISTAHSDQHETNVNCATK